MPQKPNYISLQEASKRCSYSQEYLSLRARQGKLKSVKNGRNWVTTMEWLEDYIKTTETVKLSTQKLKEKKIEQALEPNRIKVKIVSTQKINSVPENLPVENEFSFQKNDKKILQSSVLIAIAFLILFLPSVILGRDNIISSFEDFDYTSKIVGRVGDSFVKETTLSVAGTFSDAQIFATLTSDNIANKFSQASLAVASNNSQNFIYKIFSLFNQNRKATSQEDLLKANNDYQITNGIAQVDKIEMKDQVTGEVYCTWLEDGWMMKMKSYCKDISPKDFSNVVK